ncbi:MAG: hypothetical protein QOD76_1437 [Solirubrobacteraceae bacterium]|jgi:hypothetical protein|nr:hypothetical protein [Solirubrobacteraceae bacterium]
MAEEIRKKPAFRRLVVFVGAGSLALSNPQGAGAAQRPDGTASSSDQGAPITRPVETLPVHRRPPRP